MSKSTIQHTLLLASVLISVQSVNAEQLGQYKLGSAGMYDAQYTAEINLTDGLSLTKNVSSSHIPWLYNGTLEQYGVRFSGGADGVRWYVSGSERWDGMQYSIGAQTQLSNQVVAGYRVDHQPWMMPNSTRSEMLYQVYISHWY